MKRSNEMTTNKNKHCHEGQEMYDFADSIFPYCRSITGDGVRKTLEAIKTAISDIVINTPIGGG